MACPDPRLPTSASVNMHHGFRPVRSVSLPIFRQDNGCQSWFYAPGYLAGVDSDLADAFEDNLQEHEQAAWEQVAELRKQAAFALTARIDRFQRIFSPYCLTLYLQNQCTLMCRYCFTESENSPSAVPNLTLDAIRAGAELVAHHCQQDEHRFSIVFHGGGEPTLEMSKVESALLAVERIAKEYSIELFRYIATNGVLSTEHAGWLARRFDLIGLSCDGPPPIHGRNRPLKDGGNSIQLVERTADIIRAAGTRLDIRVTVMPDSFRSLTEIAGYICERLRPVEIHVEPVYRGGRITADMGFPHDQAEEFIREFFIGREVARQHGVHWVTSGSRPGELHGPYCHILRNVLQLIPGDLVSNCFKNTSFWSHPPDQIIGKFDPNLSSILLDQDAISRIRNRLEIPVGGCKDCFNQYHCAIVCPDDCMVVSQDSYEKQFRCLIQAGISERLILETAHAWKPALEQAERVIGGKVSY